MDDRGQSRRERAARLSRGAARQGRSVASHTRTAALGGARRVRRVTHAHGAGESGLGRLIELHGINTAGDAMIAVALANTLFFSVPVGGPSSWSRAVILPHRIR